MIPFDLRSGRPSDLPFVVDTWVARIRKGERFGPVTDRVRAILANEATELRIAHVPDDDDAILGWAVVTTAKPEGRTDLRWAPGDLSVHYVYVRKDARKQGIAKALLTGVENPRNANAVA